MDKSVFTCHLACSLNTSMFIFKQNYKQILNYNDCITFKLSKCSYKEKSLQKYNKHPATHHPELTNAKHMYTKYTLYIHI